MSKKVKKDPTVKAAVACEMFLYQEEQCVAERQRETLNSETP